MINESRVGKDVEGSGSVLFKLISRNLSGKAGTRRETSAE
jgi:hypothetical protein